MPCSCCNCLNCTPDKTPFAHRPVPPKKGQKKGGVIYTQIEEILDFRHLHSETMLTPDDVPEGEGEFLVKWKGCEQKDWIEGDEVFRDGLTAIRRYFKMMRDMKEAMYLKELTHISSLNDILSGGIEYESANEYKLRIDGLSDDFLMELIDPVWRKKITKNFEIVREKGKFYVWVNHVQVRYIFRSSVTKWEKKQRTRPTVEEIEAMDWFELGRYLERKERGYYTEGKEETSSEEDEEDEEDEGCTSCESCE